MYTNISNVSILAKRLLTILMTLCMVLPMAAAMGASPDQGAFDPDVGAFADQDGPIYLYFKAATYDPLYGVPNLPKGLLVEETDQYIVQFNGPIHQAQKAKLVSEGADLLGYVPDYSFMADISPTSIKSIKELPFVRSVSPLHPGLRLAPSLWFETGDVEVRIDVHMDMDLVVSRLLQVGALLESANDGSIAATVPSTYLFDIARMDEVLWVEPRLKFHISNDVSAGIMNVNETWNTYGLNGSGQIVAVADTGLDTGVDDSTMHDDLEGRIVSINDVWPGGVDGANDTNSGHGTHVAGSVLGNGSKSSGKVKGIASGARLYFQALERNSDEAFATPMPLDTQVFQPAYTAGARIHTNSWGGSISDGSYTSASRDVDRMVWNNDDMVILFAAGNDGIDSDSDGIVDSVSVDSPGTAKNCIQVGASEGYRPSKLWIYSNVKFPVAPILNDRSADDPDGMAAFSSRGYANDNRIKPDLVAPGTGILSLRSSEATGTGWGLPVPAEADSTFYMFNGGTSMATPLIAGAATLVRQHYVVNESIAPKASLIKATLINGADDMPGQYASPKNDVSPIWNNSQGWGRANLTNSIFPLLREKVYDNENQALNTGDNFTYNIDVTGNLPFKITLVWSDYYAAPLSNPALVNDLDLIVTAPNSTVYKGNVFNNGESFPGGSADNRNNVENVYIDNPSTGTFDIEVKGTNVPQGPQDYSIVFSGVFSAPPPSPPVLSEPGPGAYTSGRPTFNLSAFDVNNDYLQYRIELSKDNFTSIWRVYNQTASTSGWSKWKYATSEDAYYTVGVGEELEDGVKYYWHALGWDDTGWSVASSVRNFTVDAAAPTGLTLSINSGDTATNTRLVTLSLAATDNDSGLSGGSSGMSFSQDGTSWTAWQSYAVSRNLNLDDFQGMHRIYFRTRDAVGNMADAISSTIIYDNVDPTGLLVSIENGAVYTKSTTVNLTVQATDTTSGLSEMSFSSDGLNWASWETYLSTKSGWDLTDFTYGGTSNDGTKTVYFRVRDEALNVATEVSSNIIMDTIDPAGPSLFINGGDFFTNSRLVHLSIGGSDVTSGLSTMSLDIDGSGFGPWEPFSTSRFVTLPSGNGLKTIKLLLKDGAGNVATEETATITFDATPPDGLSIVSDINFTMDPDVTFNLTASDIDSGISDVSFSYDGDIWMAWEAWADSKVLVLPQGDGIKYVYMRVRDMAGNIGGPVMASLTLDTVGPQFTFSVNNEAQYTNITTVSIEFQLIEVGQLTDFQVSLSNDDIVWSSYRLLEKTMTWDISSGDGAKMVYAKLKDLAGNELQDEAGPVILDSTVPHDVSVSINGDDTYTSDNLVQLSLRATDENGISFMSFSLDGIMWTAYEPWSTSKRMEVSSTNGDKTVQMRVMDPAGNVMTVQDKITLDKDPPEIFTFRINDGSEVTTTYSTSNLVTYSISAFDEGTNLSNISFGFDGLTWGKWSSYSDEGELTVPATEGPVSVYVRVKDHAGNIGDPMSAIVVIDTEPPEAVSVVINEGDEFSGLPQVNLRISAIDLTSGLHQLRFKEGTSEWSMWTPFTTTKSIRLTEGEGDRTISIEVKDKAGNVAAEVSDTITLKETSGNLPTLAVRMTSPSGGDTVKGSIRLNGAISGGTPASVAIRIDGGAWKPLDNKGTWSYTWDTRDLEDGSHIIEVKANNGAEDFTSGPIMLIVKNSSDEQISTSGGLAATDWIIILVIAAIIGAVAGAGVAAALRPKSPRPPIEELTESRGTKPKKQKGSFIDITCADCGYMIEANEKSVKCSCGKIYHDDCAEAKDYYCSSCGTSF